MLKLVAVVLLAAALVGCADSDDDPRADLASDVARAMATDPASVADRLGELGLDVEPDDAAVDAGELDCPLVAERTPGDGATCTTALAGRRVTVDVRFETDGSVTVTGVGVAP